MPSQARTYLRKVATVANTPTTGTVYQIPRACNGIRQMEDKPMAYGMSKDDATRRAAELQKQHPENRYAVQPHRYADLSWGAREIDVRTWGVAKYIPYCEAMPEKFDGFVWFA